MSKHAKPQWSEPAKTIDIDLNDPIEDTIEVGEVVLLDGPIDPVPFGTEPRDREEHHPPLRSADPMPDLIRYSSDQNNSSDQSTAQEDSSLTGKVKDVAQKVQNGVQEAAQKLTDNGAAAKSAVSGALGTVKATASDVGPAAANALSSVAGKIGTTSAGAAQSAGAALWTIIQRNPLQVIAVFASLIWLFRNNKEAAQPPPVSLNDSAEKVGSVAGQVQVAANNLGSQVQQQAKQGAGWFSRTLQENPLAIGAMAVVFGAGLGFAVPESSYEHKLLGETRDKLADKTQGAAQDLGQKVQTVAQTVVYEALETAKEEAKNQGLTS
jgi:hypothetical protein